MANFEKRRVSFVGVRWEAEDNKHLLQLVTAMMMVRLLPPEKEGGPPVYEGPVFAAWENVKHQYPGLFDDLTLYGALVALMPGHSGQLQYIGQIDWIRPTDALSVLAQDDNVIDAEYEVVKH